MRRLAAAMQRSIGSMVVILTLGQLAASLPVGPQPPANVPRIGFLTHRLPLDSPLIETFRQGLRERGFVEGKNLVVEWRSAAGRLDRLSDLAAEFVRLEVALIVAMGGPALRAAKQATSTIPIVFAFSGDVVDTGLVTSLARPGGNLTGLSFMGPDLSAKRLELLKQVVPALTRVGVFWNAIEPVYGLELRETRRGAAALGVQVLALDVQSPSAFEQAFATMSRERVDALIVFAHALTIESHEQIAALAAKHRLPAIYGLRMFVVAGGLMSYGADLPNLFRRAAYYVDRILKGAKPAELPIEQPTKFELIINLKTAKALGLTIPQMLLFQTDEVIR